jgi:hypothetical protein
MKVITISAETAHNLLMFMNSPQVTDIIPSFTHPQQLDIVKNMGELESALIRADVISGRDKQMNPRRNEPGMGPIVDDSSSFV